MLVFPDVSLITINLLLQFQFTKLVHFIVYFAMGVYASSDEWFVKKRFPGRLAVWVLTCVLLMIGFLWVGVNGDVFSNPASQELSL